MSREVIAASLSFWVLSSMLAICFFPAIILPMTESLCKPEQSC